MSKRTVIHNNSGIPTDEVGITFALPSGFTIRFDKRLMAEAMEAIAPWSSKERAIVRAGIERALELFADKYRRAGMAGMTEREMHDAHADSALLYVLGKGDQ
jgi:hypothetical protein